MQQEGLDVGVKIGDEQGTLCDRGWPSRLRARRKVGETGRRVARRSHFGIPMKNVSYQDSDGRATLAGYIAPAPNLRRRRRVSPYSEVNGRLINQQHENW